MIKVCDAIMGSGKSSAAITYMNEHRNKKFVYITPYLDEAKRIKNACGNLHFAEPNNKLAQYHFKKCEHTAALIRRGRNIATTHQAFERYTTEMLGDIKEKGYTLIIDEAVNVLRQCNEDSGDIQVLIDGGYVEPRGDLYRVTGKEYRGTYFRELFKFLEIRGLIRIKGSSPDTHFFYWILPPELISSFEDVFILTYMFEGQNIYQFLNIYHLSYEHIGVEKVSDTEYRFVEAPGRMPDYVKNLRDKIHILDKPRLNRIGDGRCALSMSWFERGGDDVERLKNNIYNCYKNIWKNTEVKQRMLSTFKDHFNEIKGRGYSKAFVPFNIKATNSYRDKKYLVYAANIFMNVGEKLFYQKNGVKVDEDMYALSIMIQWIWRSAIRDGGEIYIYIPSERMRSLFISWMDGIGRGGAVNGEEAV